MRVLFDTREKHWGQNPYISMTVKALAPKVTVVPFSWRTALFGRYDLVHVHWPEYLLHYSRLHMRTAARTLFWLWLRRLKAKRVPVVKTQHDRHPFVQVRGVDGVLLDKLRRHVRGRVWLQHIDQIVPPGINIVVPHGSYEPWLRAEGLSRGRSPRTGGKVAALCVGILRPYKKFENVLSAVEGCANTSLIIAGAPADLQYARKLRDQAVGLDNVRLITRRLSDHEIADLIARASIVVVPYADLYNSGVVYLALTLGRPVLLQEGEASEDLRDEFGAEWIRIFSPPLKPSDLLVSDVGEGSAENPQFSKSRDWALAAARQTDLYWQVLNTSK